MEITKEDFVVYEKVRSTGLTNMFNRDNVIMIAEEMFEHVFTKEYVTEIMKEYSNLMKKYPDVRNNV